MTHDYQPTATAHQYQNFCSVLRSCREAQADYDAARKTILAKTNNNPSESCVSALASTICAYHFPQCVNDVLQYDQICHSTCSNLNQTCSITLSEFAQVGMRCNLKKVGTSCVALLHNHLTQNRDTNTPTHTHNKETQTHTLSHTPGRHDECCTSFEGESTLHCRRTVCPKLPARGLPVSLTIASPSATRSAVIFVKDREGKCGVRG
jgi:hypothetical protein